MRSPSSATDVPLEAVLCTEELNRRPARPPGFERENRALVALAQALADSPRTILHAFADRILEVFESDSAGISLVTEDGKRFYWPAIAGVWKPHLGGGTPRDFGPCGDVLDRGIPLMFRHFERRYTYLQAVMPPAEECLLVPFYVEGRAVGTIWAITHDDRRRFDAEDMRQLVSLGRFASSAYQAVQSLGALERQSAKLRDSEIRYRRLFESAKDGILILDANTGKILDANAFMSGLLGLEAHDLLGKELFEIGLFQDIQENKEAFRELQRTGYLRHDHLPVQNQRGETVEVEFVSNVYREDHRLVAQCNVRGVCQQL
jgi:PAS domain S-box-containing protein